MKLCRAGYWNDPRLPGKQPGERDLSRGRLLSFPDLAKQIDQRQICFASLWRKARERAAEVRFIKRRGFVHLSREEALPEWAIGHKADAKFLERRQHFHFRASRPQRVFALNCGDRLDRVGATNRLRCRLRKAEMLHLPFAD